MFPKSNFVIYPKKSINDVKNSISIEDDNIIKKINFLVKSYYLDKSKEEEAKKVLLQNFNNTKTMLQKYNNIILYGEVQSGKTNNLMLLASHLFEQGFAHVFVLTGNTHLLDMQTHKRIRDFFKNEKIIIGSYSKKRFIGQRSIVTIMKNDDSFIEGIPEKIHNINTADKIAIIDDESDFFSSGNLKKFYNNLMSHKNDNFCILKTIKYIGVTATPYKNIFSKEPAIKIQAVNCLLTATYYNSLRKIDEKNWHTIKEPIRTINNFSWPAEANIYNDITKSIIAKGLVQFWKDYNLGLAKQLFINVRIEKKKHESIKEFIKILFGGADQKFRYFDTGKKIEEEKILKDWNLSEDQLIDMLKFYQKIFPIDKIQILNSETKNYVNLKEDGIYIGGYMLSRGNTFKNLTHMIITRANISEGIVKSFPSYAVMIQNCRWLGYHKTPIKLFTLPDIMNKYKKISNVDKLIRKKLQESDLEATKKWALNQKWFSELF